MSAPVNPMVVVGLGEIESKILLVDAHSHAVKDIYDSVQNVKVYQVRLLSHYLVRLAQQSAQRRCRNLILRCDLLIGALSENAQATPSAAHEDALNEAQLSVSFIRTAVVH
jgi:hypothetical protein